MSAKGFTSSKKVVTTKSLATKLNSGLELILLFTFVSGALELLSFQIAVLYQRPGLSSDSFLMTWNRLNLLS